MTLFRQRENLRGQNWFVNMFISAVKLNILTWDSMEIDSLLVPLVDTGGTAAHTCFLVLFVCWEK